MRPVLLAGLPLAAAWLLVRRAWSGAGRPANGLALQGSLAVGLALGLASVAFVAWRALGAPAGMTGLAAALATLVVALGVRAAWHPRSVPAVAPAPPPPGDPVTRSVLGMGAALAALLAVATFAVKSTGVPHGDWDAWAIWNLRARFLFRGGDAWHDAFSPALGWSHPDYPLLLPGAVAYAWTALGREAVAVPILIAALFAAATVALCAGATGRLRGGGQGVVAALILLGTPAFTVHAASQYADVPLGYFLLATLVLLCLHDRLGHPGLAALAGAMLGLAAWTKNEGGLAVAAVLAARTVAVARTDGWRPAGRAIGPVLGGLAPGLFLLGAFRVTLAPPGDLLEGQGLPVVLARLLDGRRYLVVGDALARRIAGFGEWMAGLLIVHGALMGLRIDAGDRRGALTGVLTLGLMLVGEVGVYLVTPKDLAWHLETSLWRLLLQLWPSAVFVYCLRVRTPQERLTGRDGPGR
jgi:hypothetical protein